jgi:hypothetical protein
MYCLNETHPTGKDKARAFRSVLNVGVENVELLRSAILEGLTFFQCEERESDGYGTRYSVRMKIRIFEKEANVVTGWIIRKDEDFPRFTTCYIKHEKK